MLIKCGKYYVLLEPVKNSMDEFLGEQTPSKVDHLKTKEIVK